jgi:hypothetical protein
MSPVRRDEAIRPWERRTANALLLAWLALFLTGAGGGPGPVDAVEPFVLYAGRLAHRRLTAWGRTKPEAELRSTSRPPGGERAIRVTHPGVREVNDWAGISIAPTLEDDLLLSEFRRCTVWLGGTEGTLVTLWALGQESRLLRLTPEYQRVEIDLDGLCPDPSRVDPLLMLAIHGLKDPVPTEVHVDDIRFE